MSIASPTSAGGAADIFKRRGDDLIEAIESFKDQGCAYGRTGATCSQDKAQIKRLADLIRAELDAVKPWAPSVQPLARRTESRLTAVSMMLGGAEHRGSMLDTELTSLVGDLQEWTVVTD